MDALIAMNVPMVVTTAIPTPRVTIRREDLDALVTLVRFDKHARVLGFLFSRALTPTPFHDYRLHRKWYIL
jgi:hypothetical protein